MTAPAPAPVFRFPLLNLPGRPLNYVLQEMSVVDRVAYSLISPETKQQVCSLPQKQHASMMLFFSDFIRFRIFFDGEIFDGIDFYFFEQESSELHPEAQELPIPEVMKIGTSVYVAPKLQDLFTTVANTKGYTFKDYVDHLSDIFHCKELAMVNLPSKDIFPAEPIRKAFNRYSKVRSVNVSTRFAEKICMNFVSKAEICNITESHPFSPDSLQKVFIQNFHELCMPMIPITLNDLLLINSTEAHITGKLTDRQLNVFLKSWQAGSHSRLKKLSLHIIPTPKKNSAKRLLSGITRQEASEAEKMRFFSYRDHEDLDGARNVVFVGFDIMRLDGSATATILLNRLTVGFDMLVRN